jgi:light-harvesting complex 1 beta chain
MSTSGLTPDEAREFHDYYSKGLISFVIVAVIAHLLTWIWRPWFKGSTASADLLQPLQTLIG